MGTHFDGSALHYKSICAKELKMFIMQYLCVQIYCNIAWVEMRGNTMASSNS